MWTGEKLIFLDKSVIVPFFKEMGLDSYQFATAEYFFYATLTSQACLCVGTHRMRDSMPHVASVGGARSL